MYIAKSLKPITMKQSFVCNSVYRLSFLTNTESGEGNMFHILICWPYIQRKNTVF